MEQIIGVYCPEDSSLFRNLYAKDGIIVQNKLFNKSSLERISSPEKLNDYIQVANPGAWLVLFAMLAMLLGLLVWGFFGSITETAVFTGTVLEGELTCFVESTSGSALKPGMEVIITPYNGDASVSSVGKITEIASMPLSYDEVTASIASDYVLYSLGVSGWNIPVTIASEDTLHEGVIYSITAVTDTQRPIDLVFQ